MMKPGTLVFLLLICCGSFAQNAPSTEVEVQLFLPVHLKSEITPADKLHVYFTVFPGDTTRKYPAKIVAKKVKGNVYSMQLPVTKLWHIGFSIGPYSASMLCVNNRNGEAADYYSFNILLKKEKVDFANLRFLPPCIRGDDDE
jgi:hypothetical protein